MRLLLALVAALNVWAQAVWGQGPLTQQEAEAGIAVRDPLVIRKCGPCHHQDANGNLTRISWERTTPEGWEQAVKRMVRLNGLHLSPEEARAIVKSLASTHGLAPEEAQPVMYIAEHRSIDESMPEDVRQACAACHPIGQARSWRRSRAEWELLVAMHRGYFPVTAESFAHVDQAVDYLSKNYPLETPEWASWQARMRPPKLAGRWLISGYQAGRGKVTGEMLVEAASGPPDSNADEFRTAVTMTYVNDGLTIHRTGKSVVFGGYSWRGRSTATQGASEPSPSAAGGVPGELREVMWMDPGQSRMQGRWFWGAYEEFGYDVTLTRARDSFTLLDLDRTMIKAGATGQRVTIFIDSVFLKNTPRLTVADFDFGPGVTVGRVVEQKPGQVTVEVDVDGGAVAGKRDVSLRRAVLPAALAVYNRIDYIKVAPESALARLGGRKAPKGYQQFEAVAYQHESTADIELGPVEVEWSMEEFYSTFADDDKEFVGTLSPSGFFTPNFEGPNPQRKFSRDNYGDVWVVARYRGEGGKPLTAKSYLVVTVPLYVRFDRQEAGP